MNKYICLLFLLLLSLGCEDDHKLTLEPYKFQGESCTDCPNVELNLLKALDDTKLSGAVNNAMREEVIVLLSFDEESEVDNVKKAIASFNKSYMDLKERFPDESIGWEAKLDCEVAYEDKNILSLKLSSYTFTGGAHGYSAITFLNFDKITGEELENWELFEDEQGFTDYTETKFRIQEDVPQDSNINGTGFMFNGDHFHLAENLGYTQQGVQLVYNQYEIASYADGPKIITIPFAEANKYLKRPTNKKGL